MTNREKFEKIKKDAIAVTFRLRTVELYELRKARTTKEKLAVIAEFSEFFKELKVSR